MHDRDKSRNGCATSTATLVCPTYLATNDPKWMNESSKKFCADESPEDILQDDVSILANHEDTAEWRVLYEDMTAVTALTEYYLMKFELRRRSTNMDQYYGKRGACCNDVVDSDSVDQWIVWVSSWLFWRLTIGKGRSYGVPGPSHLPRGLPLVMVTRVGSCGGRYIVATRSLNL